MPMTEKGAKVMAAMMRKYGAKRAKQVFYASMNKGAIKGVHRKKQMHREKEKDVRAYQDLFAPPAGQIVLADLTRRFPVDGTTYVRGDTHESAFREGSRFVVLYIASRISSVVDETTPDAAITQEESK